MKLARSLTRAAAVSIFAWPQSAAAQAAVEIDVESSAYLARLYLSGRAFGACLYGAESSEGVIEVSQLAPLTRGQHVELCYGPAALGAVVFTRLGALPGFELEVIARRALIRRPDWKIFAVADFAQPLIGRDDRGRETKSFTGVRGFWFARSTLEAVPLVTVPRSAVAPLEPTPQAQLRDAHSDREAAPGAFPSADTGSPVARPRR